jgi:hypothetical protein
MIIEEINLLPLEIETPRVAAAPHPDLPNNANAGDIGSTPSGQPASGANVSSMKGNAISLLEDKFNLPNGHFGRNLQERRNAVFRFYTKG